MVKSIEEIIEDWAKEQFKKKHTKIFTKTVDENGNKLTNRSVENLSAEWVGHNILVNSGIYSKPQTQHVNLDCKFLDNAFYTVIGTIILQGLGIL